MVAITSPTNGTHEKYTPEILSQGNDDSVMYHQRKTLRKQWSVQGEPRQLLKKLRNQLAEDGCPESQYLMAKALLAHVEDLNYEENCHQAIFWLTQASLQGYLEATELLRDCLEKGLGICEQNYQDVKRCLKMDQQQKLALVAGRQLFNFLAEGNEFVTKRKLEMKMATIINDANEESVDITEEKCQQMSKQEMEDHLEEKYGSRRLTENDIIEAALDVVKGEVPSIDVDEWFILNRKSNLWDKFIYFHLFMLSFVQHQFHHKLNLVFKSHLYILFLFSSLLIFCSVSWNHLLIASLTALWVFSFLTMTFSAISVIVRQRNKMLFNLWIKVFQHFNQDMDIKYAFTKYQRNIFKSYIVHFCCMLAYLVLFPFINNGVKAMVIPPLFLVSCCLLTSLLQTNFSYNCVSSLLYVYAHYSDGHEYMKVVILNSLPSLKPYIVHETVNIFDILYLNLDVGSVFHSLWFVGLAFASLSLGFSGVLLHVLCVTWFHMCIAASIEPFGFWIYFSIVLWSLVLLLPQGIRLVTLVGPSMLFALCFYLNGLNSWTSLALFLVFCLSFHFLSQVDAKYGSLVKFAVFILSWAVLFQEQTEYSSKISSLQWEQFQNICLPTTNTFGIQAVNDCRSLRGTIVQWSATIKQMEIESIFNLPETILSPLPARIQPRLKCALGRAQSSCERRFFNSEVDRHRCITVREATGAECSLEEWNYYTFRFIVAMETNFWKFKTSDVVLLAGNEFRHVAFNLTVHDRISFTGTLLDGLGTLHPKIALSSLSCAECRLKNLSVSNAPEISFDYHVFLQSVKSTFNFFFGPAITI